MVFAIHPVEDTEDAQTSATSAGVGDLPLLPEDILVHRAAGVACWIRDLRANTVAYSPLVAELFGFDNADGFTVRDVVNRVTPEDRHLFINAIKGSMEGRDYRLHVRYTRVDGAEGTVRLTGSCELSDGVPVRVIGTAVDITEEMQYREQQLLLLSMATEAAQVATWSYDARTDQLVSSDTLARTYGLAVGTEAVTKGLLLSRVHHRDRPKVLRALRKQTGERSRFTVEYRVVMGDGTLRWLQSVGTVLRTPNGALLRVLGITRDVTQERAAREEREALLHAERDARAALVAQQQRVDLALRSAKIATWTGTPDSVAVSSTDNMAAIFDEPGVDGVFSPETLLPRIPEPWRSDVAAHIQRVFTSGGSYQIEYPLHMWSGEKRWVSEVAQAQTGEDGRVLSVIGVSRDMSAKRKLLEERGAALDAERRAREEAEKANRAKSEFLARMSHELRTPLNAIIGFANVIRRERALSPRNQHLIERVSANGRQLLDLINDVLDVARVEAGRLSAHPTQVDLVAISRDVMASLESLVSDRPVRLRLQAPSDEVSFHADPQLLRQILVNLVGNAIKFTSRGSITIGIDVDSSGNPSCLRVSDTGIGIPAERLSAVFAAFEQAEGSTRRHYGGSGLGLTIARKLCELHGWALTVNSTVGVGTAFEIALAGAKTPST
jgi:PAS domain S-box-containing protein